MEKCLRVQRALTGYGGGVQSIISIGLLARLKDQSGFEL